MFKLVDYLETHAEAVIAGPCLRDGQGNVQISNRLRPTIATFLHRTLLLRWTGLFRRHYQAYRRETLAQARSAVPVEVLMGAALMVRRGPFMRMGAWDEAFPFGGEDMELCCRARQLGQVVYLPDVEITHFGRASTRQNVAFASTRIAAGFALFFRKTGSSSAALFGYKLAVTLDAPLQLFIRGAQYAWRRLRGKRRQAERSLASVREALAFLAVGLKQFWRA